MSIPFRPVVRTQSELEEVWTYVLGPGMGAVMGTEPRARGFAGHSVWLLVIDSDDRPFPQLTEITGAVEPPDDEMVASLATVLGRLAEPGRRFAFLRSRPGPGGVTTDDRAWARALYDAGRRANVALEVVHRACDIDLVAIPMDDVLGVAGPALGG